MKKSTGRAVRALAKKLNVTITDEEDSARIYADSPRGTVFGGTFTHVVVGDYMDDSKAFAWGRIHDDLSFGLTDCEEEDCSICYERSA